MEDGTMDLNSLIKMATKTVGMSTGVGMIDNAFNLGATLLTPPPPKPKHIDFKEYDDSFNINPQLQEITDNTRALQTSLRNSGSGSGASAANLMSFRASNINRRNKLYGAKENYQTGVANKNVDLVNKESTYNNQLDNQYEQALYQHKLDKIGALSGNVAEGVGGAVQGMKDKASIYSQAHAIETLAKAFPNVGEDVLTGNTAEKIRQGYTVDNITSASNEAIVSPISGGDPIADGDFSKQDFSTVANTPNTFEAKAERARTLRPVSMINKDGSESTVRFESGNFDGKNYSYPTIFPKDPNNPSPNPADWITLSGREAFLEAQRRGELFEFDNEQEANEFSLGSWKQ